MRITWDAPIEMDDGTILRSDVFMPQREGTYPVIMTFEPYGKGVAFQNGYKSTWDRMVAAYPEILEGTTARFENWEAVDPETWVPDGYVCIRVDGRGSGRSPGKIDLWSAPDLHCDPVRLSIGADDPRQGLRQRARYSETAGRALHDTGVGPFTHIDPRDRPPAVFGGKNRLHFDGGREPYLLLPVIR